MKVGETIIVDLDCVVADFFGPLLETYNAENGTRVGVSDIKSWSMEECIGPGADAVWKRPGFFESLPLVLGAAEGLKDLLAQGHDVYVMSAGEGEALAGKSRWLEEKLPFMRERAFLSNHRTPKGALIGDASRTTLVDDGPHNVVDFKRRHPYGRAVLCEYAYATPEARLAADFVVPFAEKPGAWGHIVDYFRRWRTR